MRDRYNQNLAGHWEVGGENSQQQQYTLAWFVLSRTGWQDIQVVFSLTHKAEQRLTGVKL